MRLISLLSFAVTLLGCNETNAASIRIHEHGKPKDSSTLQGDSVVTPVDSESVPAVFAQLQQGVWPFSGRAQQNQCGNPATDLGYYTHILSATWKTNAGCGASEDDRVTKRMVHLCDAARTGGLACRFRTTTDDGNQGIGGPDPCRRQAKTFTIMYKCCPKLLGGTTQTGDCGTRSEIYYDEGVDNTCYFVNCAP